VDIVLSIKNLYFSYEDKSILSNINIDIEKGKFISIIGPNGSGKTTLLKNMSSVLIPDRGKVFFQGKDIREYSRKQLSRYMAYVPQSSYINFEFTAGDIVLMGRSPFLKPFESEKAEDIKIAEDAMRMTNVFEIKDKRITEISGGERQRVMIACALAQTPQIILLDEPVANLDIQHQVEILSVLKKLSKINKVTVITVLHDLNLSAEYSDLVVLLKEGKIIEYGPPKDIITEENIKNAYNANVYMTKNPMTGNPHVIPITKNI
jgi:iron complex transport system ATP-binding protein